MTRILFDSPGIFFVFLFVGLIIVSLAIYYSRKAKIKRALNAIPEKKIAQFTNGEYAKVKGKVCVFGETMKAPFSGRECVYYCAEVLEKRKEDHWSKIASEEMMADVVLFDGKNYAYIQTDEPMTYLMPDREFSSQVYNEPTPQLKVFLERHGVSHEGFLGLNKTLRYQEGILEAGEFCTVSGYGEWKPASSLPFDIPAQRILFLRSGKEATVYISDDPEVVTK